MQPQKAEIVSIGAGIHNEDLPAATAKILQGVSWKKNRVITILPSADMIHAKVAMSHAALMFPPNQGVHRMLCLGHEVGVAYSAAIKEVLAHPDLSQWEYVLTLEHDNIIPADGVIKLMNRMQELPHISAISGLYFMKSWEPMAHIWGRVDLDPVVNYRPCPPVPGQFVETYGTSMGMTLFRLSMFKDERLASPWFKTLNGDEGKGLGTQDLTFWNDARKYGYRCGVDCSVLVGHIDYDGKFSGIPGFVF